jgi:hypothetical protein
VRVSPDAAALRAFLRRTSQRVMLRTAIDSVAAGAAGVVVATVVAWIAAWPGRTTTMAILIAAGVPAAIMLVRARARRSEAAQLIERRAPQCRNLVFTAAELIERPDGARDDIRAIVMRHAVKVTRSIDVRAVVPIGSALRRLAIAAAVAGATLAVVSGRPAPASLAVAGANAGATASIARVDIDVVAPAYVGGRVTALSDPADVTALAGSRLRVRMTGVAASAAIETIDARAPMTRGADGRFTAEVVADREGFISIQAASGREGDVARRLIGLTIAPDRPPQVRITKPGRDLFVASAGELPIEIVAEDDTALGSLRLTFTTVTGADENFTFTDGEVPLQIARTDTRHWTASARWAIDALKLEPGNMVVYRGVAADRRPGAPPVESDSFIVQIVSPDRSILEGFVVDDDPNRYAISQQMVILKTERLIARRGSLAGDAFAEEARDIAADQRRVRAEFIFMMGGEMQDLNALSDALDETAEAANESELAAGRLQNQGRLDLIRATRQMSRAALLLVQPDAAAALAAEKVALDALQRAFTRSRYLLRTLSSEQQLDLSRRLGGRFSTLSRDARPVPSPEESPRAIELRRVLAAAASLAQATTYSRADASMAAALAEADVRVDRSSTALRQVASAMAEAATSMTRGAAPDARDRLSRAVLDLAALVRAETPPAPAAPTPSQRALDAALGDAFRGRGGTP